MFEQAPSKLPVALSKRCSNFLKSYKKLSFCLFSLFMPFLHGYETKPWLEEDLLPKLSLFAYGDGFSSVPTRERLMPIHGWLLGAGSSLRVAIFGEYAIEGELFASQSACEHFSFEALRLTGRMLLTNDSVGDAFSSSVGVTFTAPYNQALHDINRFYYGRYAWELHYAIGREFALAADWEHRSWFVATTGIANQGSPFLRLRGAWEGSCFLAQRLELFFTAEVGLGRHPFPVCPPVCCPRNFPGYAPIRYRFVDVGFIYRQDLEDIGDLGLHYTYRPFAYNLPGNEQSVCLSLTIPLPF